MSAPTIEHNGGSCAMFNITSPTLATIFVASPKVGDASGMLGVELSYTDAIFKTPVSASRRVTQQRLVDTSTQTQES
jgi:hypothetical protein